MNGQKDQLGMEKRGGMVLMKILLINVNFGKTVETGKQKQGKITRGKEKH